MSLTLSLSALLPLGSTAPVLAQVNAPGCLGSDPVGLGFVINGATTGAFTRSVSSAGDVNGDGIPDIIAGAIGADPQGRSNAGRVYVVFGKANTTSVDLNNLGSGGFAIDGAIADDQTGYSVAGIGDVNGDGLTDLSVGAPSADPQGRSGAGRVYVVFGKANIATVDLANLGSGGFAIDGAAAFDLTGGSVSGAGDVNGDGLPDLIIGARGADPRGKTLAGRAYVVFGKVNTATVDLANLGSGGFAIDGAAINDITGRSVSGAGDVNGDDLPDLIIGATSADPQGRSYAGRVYVVFGKANTTSVDLANLGSGGFAIDGATSGDYTGFSVSSAGDVNGDSQADLIIGAFRASPPSRFNAGRAYVVFGKANTATVDLANLGNSGFAINGAAIADYSGESVSGAGDVNGDGIPDLIVGARSADPQGRSSAGRVYIVFGKVDTATVDLASLGSSGFSINGAATGDVIGGFVSSAGDVNGDGIPDLIVGTPYADPEGRGLAGRAYVVYGKRTDTNPIDLLNVQLSATPDITAALLGAPITFTGNNLSSVSAITLGSVAVPFARNSSTRLTAILPTNALNGVNTLTLSTPLDGTLSFGFEVLPRPSDSPSILSVTPTTGSPGTRVIAAGADLAGATVRFCNGVPAFSRSIRTRVLFEVPSGATSGPVTVTTPNGSYNFLFTVPSP